MLYDGFVVVDSHENPKIPMGEYGENNFCGDFRGNKALESAYVGEPGGDKTPLPGLGGAGYTPPPPGGFGGGAGAGKFGQYFNADTLAAGTNLLGGIFGAIGSAKANQSPLAGNVKAVCGRKPLFNVGGKKDRYFACAERVANPQPVFAPPPPSNKGLIIGLIVAVVLIGIIITVVLVMKNKKAAVAVA